MDIPEETVKTRLHRARRQLQHQLDRVMGESVREVFAFGLHRCDGLVTAVMERIGSHGAKPDSTGDVPADAWSSQALYRKLVEGSPDAIVIADRRGMIRLWNDAAESMFGYSSAEALGRSLNLIIPEKLREPHWTGYEAVMQSGTTRYGSELLKVPALHRDGRRLSLEFRVTLLRDDAGEVIGVGAFLRDVTQAWNERKALLERIDALARDKPKA